MDSSLLRLSWIVEYTQTFTLRPADSEPCGQVSTSHGILHPPSPPSRPIYNPSFCATIHTQIHTLLTTSTYGMSLRP